MAREEAANTKFQIIYATAKASFTHKLATITATY
jgi:hypothetical protein